MMCVLEGMRQQWLKYGRGCGGRDVDLSCHAIMLLKLFDMCAVFDVCSCCRGRKATALFNYEGQAKKGVLKIVESSVRNLKSGMAEGDSTS